METVTLEYLLTHQFEKTGLENIYEERQTASLRFAPSQLSQLPRNDKDKMAELKIYLMNIYLDKRSQPHILNHTRISSTILSKRA